MLFYPLQDIETKLRSLRLAEMYNSTQAQPQVPVSSTSTNTSPWSKVKKKPRPNGGSDGALDEEAGFIQTEASLEGHDLYLDDHAVNLSPAVAQRQPQQPQQPQTQQQQPAMSNGTSTVRAQPVRLAEQGHDDSFDFETVVPFESPKNLQLIAPGKFEPYREVSEPFETSDIYKYSAKYRQQQQTKGLYQPLQPLACQPLNSARGSEPGLHPADSNSLRENHSHPNPPAPEFRSKPATLV